MDNELIALRKQAAGLYDKEKFKEIIELLTDEVLEKYKDADLYAWRARAHYRLYDDADTIMRYAQKAIDADPDYWMGYLARGNAWHDKGEHYKAIADYNKAIELKPDDAVAYYNRGIAWSKKGEYDKAIADYTKAIELKPDYAFAYNNRGIAWSNRGEFDKAIADYNKYIELKPDDADGYFNRGNARYDKGEYDNAIADYNRAIELKSDDARGYYNRGDSLRQQGKKLKEAVIDYKKYLELTAVKDDISANRARDFIKELEEKIKDGGLNKIEQIAAAIKKLLLVEEGCVTHYTTLSTTKQLVLNLDSKFRISEGAFLNDTSEGRELFEFLGIQFSTLKKYDMLAETFAPKPFIGSFVAQNKHDDLNLWRMYGKENHEEAKGCAITIKMKEFTDAINKSLVADGDKTITSIEDDIKFYRVAYWNHDKKKTNFTIPNSTTDTENKLNKLMDELRAKVKAYKKKDKSVLEKYLNNIAFLFKSDAYKSENELRLVVKGVGFEKKIDTSFTPPKVYIELINIRGIIEQITLGPKVDKPDEWASAFYYSYDKEIDATKRPEKIMISHLPFK
ncbi:MAG TPA: tetratricopeptide repeat protein [Bacteroidia bacterium]|nr:tetratricopeptide repeat protein [Bacteroidia bacterium]HNU34061.1 tetratricopeptide repeat protein [Bacteroidia bacterium]